MKGDQLPTLFAARFKNCAKSHSLGFGGFDFFLTEVESDFADEVR